MLKNIPSICPACCSKKGKLLFEINSHDAAISQVKKNKYSILKKEIESIWGGNKCKVIRCDVCYFVYSIPHKSGTEKYYSIIYDNLQYPTWRKEYNLILNNIKKLQNKNIKYLEVGAGNGVFAKKVADIIGKHNVTCFEFSDKSIEEIKNHGLTCFNKDIKKFKTKDKFSVICFFSVLHHMDNPNLIFKKLSEIVDNDGRIYIATTPEESIAFMETQINAIAYPPTHVGRWNRLSLKKLGDRHGFSIEEYTLYYPTLLQSLKDIAFWKYSQKTKESQSLASKIASIKNNLIRKSFSLFLLLPFAASSLPSAIRRKKFPSSQLICLKKSKSQ